MKRLGVALLFSLLIGAASAQLAGGLMFPGPGVPAAAGGGGRTCTDDTASTNFLTRTGGSAPNYGAGSARYADAICTFIKALETASIITGTLGGAASCGTIADVIYLLKAHTAANAILNICGTNFNGVNHGTTFTADVGYTGAAASYFDTQLAPNLGGINFVSNSASWFAATSTNFSLGTDYGSMGQSGAAIARVYPHFSDNNFYYAINSNSQGHDGSAPTPGHFYGAARNASTGATAYIDTTGTADLVTSQSPAPTLFLLADDNAGLNPFVGVMTFTFVGAGITPTQEAALQSAVATYVASVP